MGWDLTQGKGWGKGGQNGKNRKGPWDQVQEENAAGVALLPGRWRDGARLGRAQKKQERDAAAANALLAADWEEAASDAPSVSELMGASRHLARTGKELRFYPEAQALVASKAAEMKERAEAARPLAEQVAALEASVSAKVAEAEQLKLALSKTQAKLDSVFQEGRVLETRLADAKARLAATPAPCAQNGQVEAASAIRMVAGLSGLLPPECAEAFQTAMGHLSVILTGPQHVSGAAAPGVDAPGRDLGVAAPATGPGVAVQATGPGVAVQTPGPNSVTPGPGAPSLFQLGLPSRTGRGRAGRSPPPVAQDTEGFIPVPGRSRSLGGRRISGKTRSDSPGSLAAPILSGHRYFSREVLGMGPAA
jgi:hypothetical protein